jgi:hypothetical protein
MPIYYALVRNFHNNDRINWKLSGRLWAQRYRDALEEAREYQEKLNDGIPEEWVPSFDPYYIVVPTFHGDFVAKYRTQQKYKDAMQRNVTPRPTLLGSLSRLQPLEELGKDPR